VIRKGRYGQFVSGIFTAMDLLLLNALYLVYGLFVVDPAAHFFSKQVLLMLNISFFTVIILFSSIHNKRVVYADQVMLQAVKTVTFQVIVFLALISFIDYNFSPEVYLLFYGIYFVCLSIWWIVSRKLLKRYRTLGFNFRRIIIIGSGVMGERLLEELMSDSGYGYRILGVFDNNSSGLGKYYKGTLDKVEQFVKDNLIDEMFCTLPDTSDTVSHLVRIAENNAVDFYYVPQFSRNLTRRFQLFSIGNIPVMSMRPNPLNNYFNRIIKRLFDVVVSSIVLLLSPIALIPISIAIKLSSPGPVFFKQKRTGYRGKSFSCYKFRTMRVNHDSDRVQATANDPRTTKLGEYLRHTSIDELPQFFNVWRGDMSIVGPRPHMLKHTADYSALIDKYMLRHTIKPGITGWAQVHGLRGQTTKLWQMEKRVEYDVWYAENWNMMLDLKIIFLTVVNSFRGDKHAF
jgi:putative colanic acid biosynthesis UDP-glucose lipid carrier transferase